MGDSFVQALSNYKAAYDRRKANGRKGNAPDRTKYGISSREADQIRSGMMPEDIFNAMHLTIRNEKDARRKERGPAEDQRKVNKRVTYKPGNGNRKPRR